MRLFVLLFILIASTLSVQSKIVVRVENTLGIPRSEVVAVPWSEINAINPVKIVVSDLGTSSQVAYQLERQGGAEVRNLLIYTSLKPYESREYEIGEGVPDTFPIRTYCRYVPERKDDFAWENDRIAFRMYGRALEGTSENAYGTDVWAKKVDYPVIDKWYKLDNYHADSGEGLDFYKVGLTLGAGDIAPYEKGRIWYPANYHRWAILDNGPLRSTFRLEYDAWEVDGRQVTISKTITIDAGSQLNRVEAEYTWSDGKPLTLAAGLVKRKDTGVMLLDEQQGVMGYWEPADGKNGVIGTACLFRQPTAMQITDGQILGNLKLERPGKLVYYNGAAWDGASIFTSADAWFDYLKDSKQMLDVPVKVSVIKK